MGENLQCLECLKIHVMNSVAGEIFAAVASEEFQPLDIILYSVSRILGGAVATMKDYDYCPDSSVSFKFSRTFFIDYSQRTRPQQTQRLIIHPSRFGNGL